MVLQRYAVTALACVASAALLAGCGSGDRAADPASAPASGPRTATGSATAGGSATVPPGRYPTYAPTDYTYRLSVLCYCPVVGGVDVTVKGGALVSATLATGLDKGRPAPSYARKTINDIIAIANHPGAGRAAKVVWPTGAPAPQRVTVDPVRHTADAQVTYVISQVHAG